MKSNCGSSCTDLASNEAGNWKWLQGQEHEEPHRSLSIFLFPSSLYISVLCSVYLSCCYVHLKHANTSMYSLSQGERTLIPELRFIALFVLCRHFPLSTTPKGISKKKKKKFLWHVCRLSKFSQWSSVNNSNRAIFFFHLFLLSTLFVEHPNYSSLMTVV